MANMTKAELRRTQLLTRECGCLACKQWGMYREADLHHILSGGRRMGHSYAIPLCEWHHRGVSVNDMKGDEMLEMYGPSLARDKRAFVDTFGSEIDLLALADEWMQRVV